MSTNETRLNLIRLHLAASIIAAKEMKREATVTIMSTSPEASQYKEACATLSIMSYVHSYLEPLKVFAANSDYIGTVDILRYHADRLSEKLPPESDDPSDIGRHGVNFILNDILNKAAQLTAIAS
ncbi:MAG: hypothetical protein K2K68_01020 [Duncaniella sp.]|nr:hypothetical protein [Duncaniella sp.]